MAFQGFVDEFDFKTTLVEGDSEKKKIAALTNVLEQIDFGVPFSQLIADTIISDGLSRKQASPQIRMLCYEIFGNVATYGDPKICNTLIESSKNDILGTNADIAFSALSALNALPNSFLVSYVAKLDAETVVRKVLKSPFPIVRKQACATFSLLALRCQCALSGVAFKDQAFESARDRTQMIHETTDKCIQIYRIVNESIMDEDLSVAAEACKGLLAVLEENDDKKISTIDETFNFHNSEESKEVLNISPSLVWPLVPDVAEMILSHAYSIIDRCKCSQGLETACLIEGISKALLTALKFNEYAGYSWVPRKIRLEHLHTALQIDCDIVTKTWVESLLIPSLSSGDQPVMFIAAKYTILLSQYKLTGINSSIWGSMAFYSLLYLCQAYVGTVDPDSIASLMVRAIRFVPEDQLFPRDDSVVFNIYGQLPFPMSRNWLLLDRQEDGYKNRVFHTPAIPAVYRAIFNIKNATKRLSLLMEIGQVVIDYIYTSNDFTHIHKLINNNFIKGVFNNDEGNYFREEIIAALFRRISSHLDDSEGETTAKWNTIAIYMLHASSECLIWKSDIGIASEQYIDILFKICKYIKNHEEDDENKMLLNNVLRKVAIVILPSIPTQSLRLQVIWVLCQFITDGSIQRKLLCDLIKELDRKKESEEDFENIVSKFEHTSLANAGNVYRPVTSSASSTVLPDLLLRCILYIVMNKSTLSVLAYKAIYKYLQQPLDNPVKENAMNILARISLAIPSDYTEILPVIADKNFRQRTLESFMGVYPPSLDTDLIKQQKIRGTNDTSEQYHEATLSLKVDAKKQTVATVNKDQSSIIIRPPPTVLRSTLSGSSDPLVITASFRGDSNNRHLILRLLLTNITNVDLSNIELNVAVQGALHLSTVTRDAHFNMQGSLKPRATVTWEVPLNVETFERGTATPLVTFKKGEEDIMSGTTLIEGLGDLILPYTPIEIKFTDILLPAPSYQLHAHAFRMLWDRLPHSLYADCYVDTYKQLTQHNIRDFLQGPVHAIGGVQIPPFPSENIVQVAGLSKTWSGDWIAFYCLATLSYEKKVANSPNTPMGQVYTNAVTASEDSPIWFLQYEFRSTSLNAINTLKDNCQQWLDDLTNENVKLIKLYQTTTSPGYTEEGQSIMLNGLCNITLHQKMTKKEALNKWKKLSGRETQTEN
ncbi:hypothetical protein WA158_001412 [Blastocystis sp. Blastoise]